MSVCRVMMSLPVSDSAGDRWSGRAEGVGRRRGVGGGEVWVCVRVRGGERAPCVRERASYSVDYQ